MTEERGVFRKLLTEMGGRSWLLVTGFVLLCVAISTGLLFRSEFTPEHWLQAMKWAVYAIALVVGKRAVEEVGAAFGKRPPDQR